MSEPPEDDVTRRTLLAASLFIGAGLRHRRVERALDQRRRGTRSEADRV